MNIRKSLLLLIFLLCSFLSTKVVAQKENRIGIGPNIGNSWGYKKNNSGQLSIGLKLYYERVISATFSLKGNIDILLPMELFQLPIEASLIYNIDIDGEIQYFLGIGPGYYWLVNNKDHRYYSEKDAEVTYEPFDESVLGGHGITGLNFGNISIEFKYILLSVNQDETLHYSIPTSYTKKRVNKLILNTLRISFSYYFSF